MLTETVELLGKNIYKDIPSTLTIKSLPISAELTMTGAEDFDSMMLHNILPKCIEPNIDFGKLLEIDYQYLCRCVRILNYGPFVTTRRIVCAECGSGDAGADTQVDITSVACTPIPEDITENYFVISKNEFVDTKDNIGIKLLTINDVLSMRKDKQFKDAKGETNTELARMCYSICSIGTRKALTPIDTYQFVTKQLSSADYILLKDEIVKRTNFGLRAGGHTKCPHCGNENAVFITFTDERFFRPTVEDIRKWRLARNKG